MKRKVEVFTAGCGICSEVVNLVLAESCPSCDVTIEDMSKAVVTERARMLGIQAIPTIVVNDVPVARSSSGGYDIETLRASGIGVP